MGIFTGNVTSSSVDLYAPAEHEIATEGVNINFYEASVMAIAESEVFYNRAMKEIGIAEACYLAENGREMIYEAVDIKAVGEKLKNFFKKLIDKVRAIFHAFVAKISSWVSDDTKFLQKYEKEFSRKWNDVKDDFEFKGYKFSINLDTAKDKLNFNTADLANYLGNDQSDVVVATIKPMVVSSLTGESNSDIVKSLKDLGAGDDAKVKKASEVLRDSKEQIQDGMRKAVYKVFAENYCTETKGYDTSSEMDEKEFTQSLFELFRSGENEKEGIEKKDISVANIITQLRNSKKFTTGAKKSCEAVIKEIQKAIDNKVNVIIADATHITKRSREKLLDSLDLTGINIFCISFEPTLKWCLDRNEERTGRAYVPREVIKRMYKQFEPPREDENYKYDFIFTINDLEAKEGRLS